MIKTRKGFLSLALGLLGTSLFSQTYTVSGHVYNLSDEAELLIGVHVVYGEGLGTVTDLEGNYVLELQEGQYSITYSYVGFEPETKQVSVSDRNQIIDVGLSPLSISEVTVVADVARSRETPIAFSTISRVRIQEDLGAQDIPMLLNSTPGVYATQEGGGDGDAQVTIRGFSARQVGVLLDGVPVNDMENGHVYWSNWFGLDAVTRSIQVQRGLGASKLALPSVGGTINIITKGLDSRRSGSIKQEIGNDGFLRTSFGYNSGTLKNDWGISVAGTYKRGNGWVDQTWTKGYFYYLKIDKKIGKHILSLSGYGAPQSHGQRGYMLPLAVYDSAYAEKLGIQLHYTPEMSVEDSLIVKENRDKADEGIGRGLRFNQHWGYLARTKDDPDAEPEPLTERVNIYHKPQFTLKDFWSVSDKLYISNIAYLSLGRGGGVREKNSSSPNEDGLKDFQSMYNRNIGEYSISPDYDDEMHFATNYLRILKNEHNWVGLLSTINYRPSNSLSYSGGVDLRSYRGIHYEEVYDLLGADYTPPEYTDWSSIDMSQKNPLASTMLFEGDTNSFHYEGLVKWGGMFFETEYRKDRISAFMNLTGSLTYYKRIDYFFGLDPSVVQKENGYHQFPGFTAKGGVNYNFTERMNAFMNLGYLSKAPGMNSVFDYSNELRDPIENELIKGVEAGYSYSSPVFSANLNMYYTVWDNRRVNKRIPYGNADEGLNAVIDVMDAIHKGIELDFVAKFSRKLEFQGLVSLGDWIWNSRDSVEVIDDLNNVVDVIFYDAVGVHVSNSAQTQFAGEIRWEPFEDFYIKPRYTYFARYFAELDPGEPIESWKVPPYGLLNLHTGYRFKFDRGRRLQLRGNMLNVLNTTYIASAQNNDAYNGRQLLGYDARSAAVFMGLGRTFTVSVEYIF